MKIWKWEIDLNDAWDFIKRYSILLILGTAATIMWWPAKEEIEIMFMAVRAEVMAIIMSNISVVVYTKLKLTSKKPSDVVLGSIFLGVHILIGFYYFATYFMLSEVGDEIIIPNF